MLNSSIATAYSAQVISVPGCTRQTPIDEPLDRPQHRVEERLLVREDARHVKPQRHAQRGDDGQKNPYLENRVPEHLRSLDEDGPLESLGA